MTMIHQGNVFFIFRFFMLQILKVFYLSEQSTVKYDLYYVQYILSNSFLTFVRLKRVISVRNVVMGFHSPFDLESLFAFSTANLFMMFNCSKCASEWNFLCPYKLLLVLNSFRQTSQVKIFAFSLWTFLFRLNAEGSFKEVGQDSQMDGLGSEWIFMWIAR